MDNKKVELGQFFTAGKGSWLFPQVADFIQSASRRIWIDPFVGKGDLFIPAERFGCVKTIGYDIDCSLPNVIYNDSLQSIPFTEGAIVVTNPPYLSKVSAAKKKIDYSQYYDESGRNDLYQIALDNIFSTGFDKAVAIVPESFINSGYPKTMLTSLTSCEADLFNDTTEPVVILCMDAKAPHTYDRIKVYKDSVLSGTLQDIEDCRLKCSNDVPLTFNNMNGWLGLQAVDYVDPHNRIRFGFSDQFDYDWKTGIKVSSRHMSLIDIAIPDDRRAEYIARLNAEIEKIRHKSSDLMFTPFMGNTNAGKRRRRLDYHTARAILENVYHDMFDCRLDFDGKTS